VKQNVRDKWKTRHVHLRLKINFKKKLVRGNAVIHMIKSYTNLDFVKLNSKSQKILKVVDQASRKTLKYEQDGDNLKVFLLESSSKRMKIRIHYKIKPDSGLVWLTPAQTAGKKKPFLFSQGDHGAQNYFCVLFPCQHTTRVKTTFSAKVLAPVGMTVLMSGVPGVKRNRYSILHKFRRDVPVPSYLVAIAVGNLGKRRLSLRSNIWSEPEILETAAEDFSQTVKMLKTGEDICGPYMWKIHNFIVMPTVFAFAGVENPGMTFASPTLVTGDNADFAKIVHPIAHSWAGNLVTNANKKDWWVNEGLACLIEGKILGRIHSEARRDLSAILYLRKLQNDVDTKFNQTALVGPNVLMDVAYGKGMVFARYLEDTVGGPPIFEKFLKAYFNHFANQSIETKDFQDYFLRYFSHNPGVRGIDWDTWLYKPGMPVVMPKFDYSLVEECKELARYWQGTGVRDMDQERLKTMFNKLIAIQRQEFLDILREGEALGVEKIKHMSDLYALDGSPNAEILMRWWRLGIKARHRPIATQALKKIRDYGRYSIIGPLYEDLYNWKETRQAALNTFSQHKPGLMKITIRLISRKLYRSLSELESSFDPLQDMSMHW